MDYWITVNLRADNDPVGSIDQRGLGETCQPTPAIPTLASAGLIFRFDTELRSNGFRPRKECPTRAAGRVGQALELEVILLSELRRSASLRVGIHEDRTLTSPDQSCWIQRWC